jgi:hypothetical protein
VSQESAEVLGPPAGRIARSAGVLVFISALTKPVNFLREAIFSGETRTLAIDLMLALCRWPKGCELSTGFAARIQWSTPAFQRTRVIWGQKDDYALWHLES